jgi:protein SCO1/2
MICNKQLGRNHRSPHRRVAASPRRRIAPSPRLLVLISFCLLSFAFCLPVFGQGGWESTGPPQPTPPASTVPKMLENVGIEQRLNEPLPLDATFRDEDGNLVRLGDYFGQKPVIIALVYYSCPQLCNQILNGLTSTLKTLDAFDIGKEFNVLAVSFDPREKPELANQKKATYTKWYDRPTGAAGWHFLTGDQAAIDQITAAIGFHYAFDPATGQFAHASGVMIATPQGKLSHYFFGVEYGARDLRLGLVEASNNQIGSPVDRLILYCFHYDPSTGKYSLAVINLIRLGGGLTIVGMFGLLWVMRRRSATRHRELGGMV